MKKLRSLTFPVLLLISCLIGSGIWAFTNPEKWDETICSVKNLFVKPPHRTNSFSETGESLVLNDATISTQGENPRSFDATNQLPPTEKARVEPIDGNDLIRKSRLMMQEKISGFSAEILQIIQTPETSYRATGSYSQTSDLKSRLELEMEIEGIKGRMLQVSNGQVVWIVRELKNLKQIQPISSEDEFSSQELRIERIDLKRLFDFAESENISFRDSRFAKEFAAGIPGLLACLEDEMNFTFVKQVSLQGVAHHVLQGEWKVPIDQREFENIFSAQVFAAGVPQRVRIYLRASDLMLARYLCLNKRPDKNGWYAPLAMELSNIIINGDLTQTDFNYQPTGEQVSKDVTHQYLNRLKNSSQKNERLTPNP